MLDYSKFRDRPIPRIANPPTALDYKDLSVDLTDNRAQEPLVDLSDYGVSGLNFYARRDGLNAPYRRSLSTSEPQVRVRESLADRLSDINEELVNLGIEFFALNGFRPLAVQQDLWAFFMSEARTTLPDPTKEACVAFAGQYCSDPRRFEVTDPRTWPTHITGGAIDLTLRNLETKEHLFFGGVFDDPAAVTHTRFFEERLETVGGDCGQLTLSELEALQNRRLLYWAMCSAGFTNYAFEWWHYDLGTQLWAANRSAANDGNPVTAWYGPAVL